MSVTIKSEREIELMREAGRILATVHNELARLIRPGITTMELNRRAEEMIRSYGCLPSFLNYEGYPESICTSVNDAVVHGIPSKHEFLLDGDIISIDAGVIYKGYQSDAARTWTVGEVSEQAKRLIRVTEESFYEGIRYATEGNYLHQISAAIEDCVIANGFTCVRDLVGHGIGTEMHEDPQIPNFHQKRKGIKLQAGMTLAIEPMVNVGRCDVCVLDNDWTVVTEDGSLSSHYENTILITKEAPEILSVLHES